MLTLFALESLRLRATTPQLWLTFGLLPNTTLLRKKILK
jgi:hypothetical protein